MAGKKDTKEVLAADYDDIDRDLPIEMRAAVGNMMFAWGHYDSAVTYWLAKTLGTPLDVASIMYGRMDTGTKLTRLLTLHEHYGQTDAATGIKGLRAAHNQRVVARNAVAHSRCLGRLKSEPSHFAFSTVQHIKGEHGMLSMTILPLAELYLSTQFAEGSAAQIMDIAGRMPTIVTAPHPGE